ncbi:MAG TPA: response regulator transcription factor [Salinarimonas sp.]|nr:response regulator transcription factor [Salinarimonas sp.]
MPTVAILEDENDLREAIVEYLEARALTVLAAGSASAFRSLVEGRTIDVAVLDIAMPGEDGRSVARWLVGQARPPGVIFASAAGSTADRVVGLEIGVDDYLVKPYDPRELLARIRSVLRRVAETAPVQAASAPAAASSRQMAVGPFQLDLDSRRLAGPDGAQVSLTAAELDLLEALAQRPGRVLSRAQLLELAPAREGNDSARAIDVRITRLRRKLEADPDNPTLIRTVRGEGYVFAGGEG